MVAPRESRRSTYFLGVAGLALGAVGLLLFFMPVLGIPLAGCGVVLALIAVIVAIFGGGGWDFRWGVLAFLLAMFALAANLLVQWQAEETLPQWLGPGRSQPAAPVYVSPPPAP